MNIDSAYAERVMERLPKLSADELERFFSHLLRERDFFESVVRSVPQGVMVADGELNLVWANDSARELLSLRPGARLDGTPMRDVLRRPELAAVLREYEDFRAEILQREVVIAAPRMRVLSVTAVPFRVGMSELGEGASTWVIADRTETERRSEERRQSARIESLATLTAGIAHEIKNPLNSLTIHVQLLRKGAERVAQSLGEDSPEVARMRRSAEILEEEVHRLATIVEEFLGAVRPIRAQFRKASIADLLVSLAELFGPECESHGIELALDLDPSMPLLRMDPDLIRQALVNLIRNAIEAIAPPGEEKRHGGRIVLRTALKADHALIEVQDDGPGIAEEDRLRIFEPYHTTKFHGTGLGLMVVYKCVHAHDGRVGLTSEPGAGTVFHIALPLDEKPVRLLGARTLLPLEIDAESVVPGDASAPRHGE